MRRSPGEYVVIASIAASLAYWTCLLLFGSVRIIGRESIAAVQIALALGLGAASLWLLMRRSIAGASLSATFYGMQILNVTLSSGGKIGFNSLPTFYYRIAGDSEATIKINVVSLLFFLFSALLWHTYRREHSASPGTPPNTSLERTREG